MEALRKHLNMELTQINESAVELQQGAIMKHAEGLHEKVRDLQLLTTTRHHVASGTGSTACAPMNGGATQSPAPAKPGAPMDVGASISTVDDKPGVCQWDTQDASLDISPPPRISWRPPKPGDELVSLNELKRWMEDPSLPRTPPERSSV